MSQKRYATNDLELPDDEPMVVIRSSFLWICDGDKYAAATLNMYVHWTKWIIKHRPVAQAMNKLQQKQGKTPTQDTSLVLYRKQSDLVKDLLGFCTEKRLRQANALLISKGLLKIDDSPRSISDHILKYELQIDRFKELMAAWKAFRSEQVQDDEVPEEIVEVALEEDGDGTVKRPSRNGEMTAPSSVRNGDFTERSGKKTASINRYISKEMIEESKKESVPDNDQRETTTHTHTRTSSSTLLTPEQHIWFENVFCKGYWWAVSPKLTPTLAEHVKTLYPIIETVEELNSLYDYEKDRLKDKSDPIVKPGNLASPDTLNAWKQTRQPLPMKPKPQSAHTESTGQYGMINFGKDPRALAFFRERTAK